MSRGSTAMVRFVCFVTCAALLAGAGCDAKSDKASSSSRKKASDDEEASEAKPRLPKREIENAKNALGAMMRGAVGAFERESADPNDASGSFSHRLCKTGSLVPAKVPLKGESVKVESDSVWDGDAATGWQCLKFTQTNGLYFQYSYVAGSGYKGLDRGAKNPGPKGFQVCAEADVEPGGKTLLLCGSGSVSENDVVKLDPEFQTLEE